VDWTEIEPTHQAFLNKRSEFPLNLNNEQREAYAAWLAEVEPTSRELIKLRAEAHGLSANGMEDDRGYYIDGFRDGTPVYVVTANVTAAVTTGVSYVRWNPGNPRFDPALGDTINGGEFYVNVNDHGTIYEHTEFQLPNAGGSRIVYTEVNDGGNRNHMTHVAGTIAAWGYDSTVQGMAPRSWIRSLIQQNTWHITNFAMSSPGQTMADNNPHTGNPQLRSVVGNTSLGTSEPYNRYNSTSATYDNVMRDHPYYMHFNSSGNSGSGYETLTGAWKIAKNMIGIGNASAATRDANGVYTGGGTISSGSSRGPTYDGRINPDFVAKGSSVKSTVDTTGTATYSGTSMASPNSAGSVALLMDYVRQRLPQQYLRSSTYRALLATTADDRGNPGPDYIYGWGILNIHAAAKIVRQQAENPALRLIMENSLSPNQTWTGTYASDGTKPIRVTIAWLDPASTNTDANSRASRLVNDLDLRLIGPGGTEHRPYVMPFTTGQGATPAYDASLYGANAVPGDNFTDPVEQVYIAAPTAGTYTVQVTHKNNLLNNQAQPYSVAVSGLTNVFGVTPVETFTSAGPQGGPFDPTDTTYTITNNGATPLDWSVAASPSAPWLTISPSSGTIAASSSATVTVSFNTAANSLAAGTHTTGLVFSAGGVTETRQVSLQVRPMTGFAWDTIPSLRYWQSPFSVGIRAVDSTGATVRAFTGTAALTPIAAGTGAGTVEIGTGTTTWDYPLKASGQKARTQSIYLSSELGGANSFTGLALNVAGTPGQTLTHLTIRVKHTTTSSYHPQQSTWEASGWTVVYQQNVTISETGWVEFPFSAPFDYNGTNNLFVDISFNNSSSSTDGTVRMTSVSDRRSLTGTSTTADPLTWTITPTRVTTIPNIKLLAPGGVTITPTVTGNFTGGVWNGLVTFNEAAASVYLRASSGGLSGNSNSFAVEAKTIPTVTTWPTTNAITYGQAAGASTLSGGSASVPGSFTFINPSAILPAGTNSVAVIFTPTDSESYGTVEGMVDLVVAKATPTVSAWPTATSIVYGQALSASTLSGGTASIAGTFAFVSPTTTPNPGSYNAAVRFTPVDSNNHHPVDGSVTVDVAKATPIVSAWPTASGMVYGQPLSASVLTGGTASVAGTFAFNAPATTPNAGIYSAAVTFTPTDTTNYNTVGGNVNVVVAKATPVVHTWPTASAIEYGQVIADSVLSGGSASVPGIFVFAESGAGFNGSDAFTFKVNDGTVDSAPATVTLTVETVGQSAPEGGPDPLAQPEADSTQTTADRISDIYITCDNGYELYVNGALLGTGNNWQSAQRYQNTPLQVGRNVVAVKGIDEGGIAALLAELVVGGQRIGSSNAWKVSLTAPADWKDPGFDDSAWVAASDYGAYGVSPWSKNAAGMPSDTPARWIWSWDNDAHNTVYFRYVIDVISPNDPPVANPQSVSVPRNTPTAITLTGSDPDNDPLTFEIVTPPTYGTLTGDAPNVTYTPPSMLDPGIHHVMVVFIPTEEANYNTVSDTVELEVLTGSTVAVTEWPTASGIVYGQTLSDSTLSGGAASVDGTFAFNDPNAQLGAGTHSVAVTFTPDDTATYNPVQGGVSVTVDKAAPVVTAWPSASSIDYGDYLSASTLSGGSASVAGHFSFEDSATAFIGQDAFTFRVSDGEYTSDPATVSITVGEASGEAQATAEPNASRPWTPDDITTLAWYDAADTATIAHVSNVVSQWDDKSGNARHVSQGASGQRPTVSGSTISFDGTDDYLMHGSAFVYAAGSADVYLVAGVGTTVDRRLVSENLTTNNNPLYNVAQTHNGDGSRMGTFIRKDDGNILYSNANAVSLTGAFSRNTPNLYHWRDTGSSMAGRVAGGSATTVNYSRSQTLTLDRFTIGGIGPRPSTTTGSVFVNAGINEVVITANLSDENRQKMEGYLAWKWNLEANLPADHPYKQAAPVVITNDAPVAHAQSVTTVPGTPVAITLTGSDPDGDPLSFEIVSPPTHGTLAGDAPDVTYTPPQLPEPGMHSLVVRFTPTDAANYQTVTGMVSVSVIEVNSSGYDAWAARYPDLDLSDPNGDTNGDGLSNFYKFAFGLDPHSSTPVDTHFDKTNHSFSYQRRADSGLSYTVCISTDLIDWQDMLPEHISEIVAEGTEDEVEFVEVTLLEVPESNHLFMRVKAHGN